MLNLSYLTMKICTDSKQCTKEYSTEWIYIKRRNSM